MTAREKEERKEVRIVGMGGQGVCAVRPHSGKGSSNLWPRLCFHDTELWARSPCGSCTADVVISPEPIAYPYVTSPQVIVLFDPGSVQ